MNKTYYKIEKEQLLDLLIRSEDLDCNEQIAIKQYLELQSNPKYNLSYSEILHINEIIKKVLKNFEEVK